MSKNLMKFENEKYPKRNYGPKTKSVSNKFCLSILRNRYAILYTNYSCDSIAVGDFHFGSHGTQLSVTLREGLFVDRMNCREQISGMSVVDGEVGHVHY